MGRAICYQVRLSLIHQMLEFTKSAFKDIQRNDPHTNHVFSHDRVRSTRPKRPRYSLGSCHSSSKVSSEPVRFASSRSARMIPAPLFLKNSIVSSEEHAHGRESENHAHSCARSRTRATKTGKPADELYREESTLTEMYQV